MGKTRKLRLEAEENWPQLTNFTSAYLGESWSYDAGSPEAAVDQAVSEHSLERRQAIAREWWDWNASAGSQYDPRRHVNDGLGVNVHFKKPEDARAFMNTIYDKLVISIKSEVKGWKP